MPTSLPDLNELAAKVGAAGRAAQADPSRREVFAEALLEFCEGLHEQHEFEDAAGASAEAMRTLSDLIAEGRRDLSVTLGIALRHHADALIELGQDERALEVYASAIRLLADLAQADVGVQPEFSGTLLNYGEALRRCGRAEQALEVLDQALRLFGSFSFGDDGDPTQIPSFALTQLNRGKALAELDRADEALAATQEAVAVFHEFGDGLPHLYAVTYADALDALATLLRSLGRVDEALEPAEKGLALIARIAQGDSIRYLYPLARLSNNLARGYQQTERFERAAALFEQAVSGFRILADAQPHAHRITLIRVMSNHGLSRAQIGDFVRAHAIASEALELAEREEGWGLLPLLTGSRQFLADLCGELGRGDEAIEHLVAGMRLLKRAIAEDMPGAAEAAKRLGASAKAASEEHRVGLPDDVAAMLG